MSMDIEKARRTLAECEGFTCLCPEAREHELRKLAREELAEVERLRGEEAEDGK